MATAIINGKRVELTDEDAAEFEAGRTPSADQIYRDRVERIAATRYEHETAGIVINGYRVPTDDRSKSLLAGKALRATRDPDLTCQWKTPDGWKTLDGDAVLAIAEAVDDHVQACFDREKELLDKLDAGEFDESMLEEGWPE